jgi:hypothetical protein
MARGVARLACCRGGRRFISLQVLYICCLPTKERTAPKLPPSAAADCAAAGSAASHLGRGRNRGLRDAVRTPGARPTPRGPPRPYWPRDNQQARAHEPPTAAAHAQRRNRNPSGVRNCDNKTGHSAMPPDFSDRAVPRARGLSLADVCMADHDHGDAPPLPRIASRPLIAFMSRRLLRES